MTSCPLMLRSSFPYPTTALRLSWKLISTLSSPPPCLVICGPNRHRISHSQVFFCLRTFSSFFQSSTPDLVAFSIPRRALLLVLCTLIPPRKLSSPLILMPPISLPLSPPARDRRSRSVLLVPCVIPLFFPPPGKFFREMKVNRLVIPRFTLPGLRRFGNSCSHGPNQISG